MRQRGKKKGKNKDRFESVVLLGGLLFQCVLTSFSPDPIGGLIQVINGGMFSLLLVKWMKSLKNK